MRINEPSPEMYADEPLLVRTGPHWVSNDITIGLAALAVGMLAFALVFQREWWIFSLLPASVLVIRLAIDLPRFWRFEVVLTTRRLVVNVGTLRDVYHTLNLKHVVGIDLNEDFFGRLLGYGEVVIDLEAESPGKPRVEVQDLFGQ